MCHTCQNVFLWVEGCVCISCLFQTINKTVTYYKYNNTSCVHARYHLAETGTRTVSHHWVVLWTGLIVYMKKGNGCGQLFLDRETLDDLARLVEKIYCIKHSGCDFWTNIPVTTEDVTDKNTPSVSNYSGLSISIICLLLVVQSLVQIFKTVSEPWQLRSWRSRSIQITIFTQKKCKYHIPQNEIWEAQKNREDLLDEY